MDKKEFTINGRKFLGIRDAEFSELESLLRVLPKWHSILADDLVLSACMSLMMARLQELDPVHVDSDLVEDAVTVYLGEYVEPLGGSL